MSMKPKEARKCISYTGTGAQQDYCEPPTWMLAREHQVSLTAYTYLQTPHALLLVFNINNTNITSVKNHNMMGLYLFRKGLLVEEQAISKACNDLNQRNSN